MVFMETLNIAQQCTPISSKTLSVLIHISRIAYLNECLFSFTIARLHRFRN